MSLVFSDTSVEKAGLIQVCEANIFGDNGYAQISGHASRLAIFTNYLNEAFSRYATLAMKSLGWNWDDSNYTTDPIPVADLVDGQQSYSLATSHIQILSVEVKVSASGAWKLLKEIDEKEFVQRGESLSGYYDNAGTAIEGVPDEYNLIGPSIFLYPTPSYNSTGGLRIRIQRPPSYFATTDTTKTPGFTETHHTYLTDYATMKYGIGRTLESKKDYVELVRIWEEKTIPTFYGERNKARDNVMRHKQILYI